MKREQKSIENDEGQNETICSANNGMGNANNGTSSANNGMGSANSCTCS